MTSPTRLLTIPIICTDRGREGGRGTMETCQLTNKHSVQSCNFWIYWPHTIEIIIHNRTEFERLLWQLVYGITIHVLINVPTKK